MKTADATTLLRTVAREKGAISLAVLPDEVLAPYVDRMSRYPLAIKWVVGQVALGKDINVALGDLTSSTGDVAKFCFAHVFDSLLSENARLVLYALAAYGKPLVRGVLSHASNLAVEELDAALRDLSIASLVVPTQQTKADGTIETRYELLPLTREYIYSRLQAHPQIFRPIKSRIEMVWNLIEEAERAGKQYRYSLRDMGADTEEEKVAATWAITGYQKYQAGDYDGAVEAFNRAAQTAPHFPAIYRNWATVESEAGFYEKADELMKKATRLNPHDSRLWFVWGNIEKRRQRYDRAYECLKKALELAPNDAPILGALGEVEKRRGNHESAHKLLTSALKEGAFDVPRRRHEIVCYTSLADNSRRWAESLLRDQRKEECLTKLEEAYQYAVKAAELGKDDLRAQDTLREVCLDLAIRYLNVDGLERARPYFERTIVRNPRRAKEKRSVEAACHYLADALLEANQSEEARKYYNLGRKCLSEGTRHAEHYQELAFEFSHERTNARLYHIVQGKGYGFLEFLDSSGQTAFLHFSQVIPKTSLEDFEAMKGTVFSIIPEKGDKGPVAKRARPIREVDK